MRAILRMTERTHGSGQPAQGKVSQIFPINEGIAANVLVALREGKTLNICNGRVCKRRYVGAERITVRIRFRQYCEAHPDFAQEAHALLAENLEAANARKGEWHRTRTHCPRGHLYPPSRKCAAYVKFFRKNPKLPTEDQIQRVTAALNAGQTIGVICRGKIGNKKLATTSTMSPSCSDIGKSIPNMIALSALPSQATRKRLWSAVTIRSDGDLAACSCPAPDIRHKPLILLMEATTRIELV